MVIDIRRYQAVVRVINNYRWPRKLFTIMVIAIKSSRPRVSATGIFHKADLQAFVNLHTAWPVIVRGTRDSDEKKVTDNRTAINYIPVSVN